MCPRINASPGDTHILHCIDLHCLPWLQRPPCHCVKQHDAAAVQHEPAMNSHTPVVNYCFNGNTDASSCCLASWISISPPSEIRLATIV
jgi:hypothetical protein